VNLTLLRDDTCDPASGEADAREALALTERHGGAAGMLAVDAREGLAAILHQTGRQGEAEVLRRRNVAILLHGGPSNDLADALDVLGTTLSKEGRHDEAIAALRRSQAMYGQLHGKDDKDYIEV
jgi:eukaryotic-like serine/threonine-protein kinase